jgi:phosphoglycolate phosphatase
MPELVKRVTEKPLPRPVECVVLDLDGTLVDSIADLADAIDAMLARYELPPIGLDRVRTHVGSGARNLVASALLEAGAPAVPVDAALAAFFEIYRANHLHKTVLYPGTAQALERLHAAGVRLAVASNKPYEFTASLLRHLGVASLLDAILGGDSLPQRKPDPRPVLAAVEACGATAGHSVVVGDGEHDMAAARAAGLYAVGCVYGLRDAPTLIRSGADALIDSMAELAPLLGVA